MENNQLTKRIGTVRKNNYFCQPFYVAPEVLTSKFYDEKCDVWSCGVILFILLVGHPPFYGKNDDETYLLVKKGELKFPTDKWARISEEAKDLVSKMLVVDPKIRISAVEAYGHKFL